MIAGTGRHSSIETRRINVSVQGMIGMTEGDGLNVSKPPPREGWGVQLQFARCRTFHSAS